MTHDRRLDRLEKLLFASPEEENWMRLPIPDEDRAILQEAENMEGSPDDPGPPRPLEFFDLAISRALEKRGCSAARIAEAIAEWRHYFEEAKPGAG